MHIRDVPIPDPITALRLWSRYRAVSRDGKLTQYVNGEAVQTRTLAANHDLWFALRTWRRSQGMVRDLRITGKPDIPDEVEFITDASLDGWVPFFERGFGAHGNWSGVSVDDGSVEIRGRIRPELQGAAVEKLLRYYRPLLEDGTLTYEFYYKEGESAVFPAVGNSAFLLHPGGVHIHELTHRDFERLGRDPGNERPAKVIPGLEGSLSLVDDNWNSVTIEIREGQLKLVLNEVVVYEQKLNANHPVEFGLFHFADRTSARVRRIVWQGEWPKELPGLSSQTLASQSLRDLESRVERLPLVLNHNFTNGVPDDLFDFSRGAGGDLKVTADGLRIERSVAGGNTDLFTCLQLHGDFEIVAHFDDLAVEMPVPRWNAGIGLRLAFENDEKHRCSLFRSTARKEGNRRVQFYESSERPDGSRRHSGDYLVEESRSGRLRLVRSGTTVYGFYGPGDSPHDRLVAELEVTDKPTTVRGLSLGIEGAAPTSVGTLWKSLTIRAEKATSLPVEDSDAILKRLDARRAGRSAYRTDFADRVQSNRYTTRTSGRSTFVVDETGLRATAESDGPLTAASIICATPGGTEFDVEAAIDIHQFDAPVEPHRHSEITMRVFLHDELEEERANPEEASLLLRKKGDDRLELVSRVVRLNAKRKHAYRPIRTVTVPPPSRLRIAQYDGRLWFLYTDDATDESRVFAEIPVPLGLSARSVVLTANAIDSNHVTDVTFESLEVSARTP